MARLPSDSQKAHRARQALLILAAPRTAEKLRWAKHWTGDQSSFMWFNPPTGSWMTIDEELPQSLRHGIGATKHLLAIFFNLIELASENLVPHGTSSTVAYFVDNVIIPLASRDGSQLGDIARCKLHLHFDNSKYYIARHV
jgi:hypothetical protein